jgi:hypothetical protein
VTKVHHRRADQAGVDAGAEGRDGAGCLGAGYQRQRDRVGPAFPVLQVNVVDPDPTVAHHDLACRRDRIGPVGHLEFFRPAMT